VADDLKRNGFASKGWWQIVPLDGTQKVVGASLQMTQKGGDKKRENMCMTLRPIRAVQGFNTGVKFRAKTDNPDKVKAAVGIRVKDNIGNQMDWFFDGQSYKMFWQRTKGGKVSSTTRALKQTPFGDEAQNLHEIGFRYVYETEKLTLLLDGKDVGEYEFEMVVFQLQVFVDVTGEGECSAVFQDVRCDKQ